MPKESSSRVKIFYPRYSRAELVERIQGQLAALAEILPLKRVVLFGSWAKGKATAFSDVDLLVVYADPPREDAYQIVWKSLDIRGLEPHVYSQQEATERKRSLKQMAEDGILLFPPTQTGRPV